MTASLEGKCSIPTYRGLPIGRRAAELMAHFMKIIKKKGLPRGKPLNKNSEPERIRTFDRLLRREVLYPAELLAHRPLNK
jgi:hypothetical protein